MHGGVMNGGVDGGGICERSGQAFNRQDCIAVEQGLGSATTPQTLNSQGLTEQAFDTLMDVESLIFETTALLNAASIVNRSERGEERTG
jgi:hypothetical protein